MVGLLVFSRNLATSVEEADDRTIRSRCRLQDTLLDAVVEITVTLPDLEITAVRGEVSRCDAGMGTAGPRDLGPVAGVRIGPGMGKIIQGFLSGDRVLEQLASLVEECCHAVILAFTKESLREVPGDEEEARKFFRGMVIKNRRLYNRCAAYAPGSSLVEGIGPDEGYA